jgi:hypothetical protein
MMGAGPAPATKGFVLRSPARYYHLLVWLLTFGRERKFREPFSRAGALGGGGGGVVLPILIREE